MTYREDVDKIITKRREEIFRLNKAINAAKEKIQEKREEVGILEEVLKVLEPAQPELELKK